MKIIEFTDKEVLFIWCFFVVFFAILKLTKKLKIIHKAKEINVFRRSLLQMLKKNVNVKTRPVAGVATTPHADATQETIYEYCAPNERLQFLIAQLPYKSRLKKKLTKIVRNSLTPAQAIEKIESYFKNWQIEFLNQFLFLKNAQFEEETLSLIAKTCSIEDKQKQNITCFYKHKKIQTIIVSIISGITLLVIYHFNHSSIARICFIINAFLGTIVFEYFNFKDVSYKCDKGFARNLATASWAIVYMCLMSDNYAKDILISSYSNISNICQIKICKLLNSIENSEHFDTCTRVIKQNFSLTSERNFVNTIIKNLETKGYKLKAQLEYYAWEMLSEIEENQLAKDKEKAQDQTVWLIKCHKLICSLGIMCNIIYLIVHYLAQGALVI